LIKFITDREEKKRVSSDILYSLPEWFGIPESTEAYINDAENMLFICDEKRNGFAVLNPHNADTIEIQVIGVKKEFRHSGIGKQLVGFITDYARMKSYKFIEVKTLDESNPDANYAATRKFYETMRFRKLECIKQIWGEKLPCLIMVRPV